MTALPEPGRHRRPPTSPRTRAPALPVAVALLFVAIWTGAVTTVSAHDAGVATIRIAHHPSDIWTFELRAPSSGLDRAMRRFHEARSRDLADLDPGGTRYKELLVEYVKATFELEPRTAGGEGSPAPAPRLGAGRMKLGDHDSVLVFAVEDMPATVDELTVRLPYLADEAGQQNVLWLVDGERSESHVLNAENAFAAVDVDFFEPEAGE